MQNKNSSRCKNSRFTVLFACLTILFALSVVTVQAEQEQDASLPYLPSFFSWLTSPLVQQEVDQTQYTPLPSGTDGCEAKEKKTGISPKYPVVIIPALTGSQLQSKLTNKQSHHFYCFKNSDWFTMYLNKKEMFPMVINCLFEDMSLTYDPNAQTYSNFAGVDVRTIDYGGVDGVAFMDEARTIGMWNKTIQALIQVGYQPSVNLRAAPYDWRRGPEAYIKEDFPKLKQLIEDTYELNNQTPIVAVSLSMGSPYFALFLNQYVNQSWKNKYIKSFVSWSGVFSGSVNAALALAGLEKKLAFYINNVEVRALFQNYGSIVWLLPSVYNSTYNTNYPQLRDQVFVSTPAKEYKASDMIDLMTDAGATVSAQILNNIQATRNLGPPGVEMYCVFGYNVSTMSRLDFASADFTDTNNISNPKITNDDGDGVVLGYSLQQCEQWANDPLQNGYPIHPVRIPNMEHADPLFRDDTVQMLITIATT